MSEAKDLLAGVERREMILRFAQDDKSWKFSLPFVVSTDSAYCLARIFVEQK